jgi:tetratricopeptide (TPR) repeat protein
MPLGRRTEMHRSIAAAIEQLYQANLTPHLAALAHHYRQAAIADRAMDYLKRAGDAAALVFAYEDAIRYWRSALELMKEHNCAPDPQARILVDLGIVRSFVNVNDSTAFELLEEALNIYEKSGRQCGSESARNL